MTGKKYIKELHNELANFDSYLMTICQINCDQDVEQCLEEKSMDIMRECSLNYVYENNK